MQINDSRLENYVHLPYAIRIIRDDIDGEPCYIAVHPELPGCSSMGDSPAEAVANLADARADYVRVLLRRNLPVPMPSQKAAESGITVRNHGITIEVHVPH